eukprot:386620-Prorocentrum_minimum.AAC.2
MHAERQQYITNARGADPKSLGPGHNTFEPVVIRTGAPMKIIEGIRTIPYASGKMPLDHDVTANLSSPRERETLVAVVFAQLWPAY